MTPPAQNPPLAACLGVAPIGAKTDLSRQPEWAYRREAPYQRGAGVCFPATGNKNAGNAQQNARRERLYDKSVEHLVKG